MLVLEVTLQSCFRLKLIDCLSHFVCKSTMQVVLFGPSSDACGLSEAFLQSSVRELLTHSLFAGLLSWAPFPSIDNEIDNVVSLVIESGYTYAWRPLRRC